VYFSAAIDPVPNGQAKLGERPVAVEVVGDEDQDPTVEQRVRDSSERVAHPEVAL
jgi:hypothetical protein